MNVLVKLVWQAVLCTMLKFSLSHYPVDLWAQNRLNLHGVVFPNIG